MTSSAVAKLTEAQKRTGSLLSIGLEPCPEYQAPGLAADIDGYRAMMTSIITGTRGLCCAYKFNLAFFESLGVAGWELLFEIRELIPDDVLLIGDAKRSDIGTTAARYATALYDQLRCDSATVNPMMGTDSVEPFLEHADRLTFLLCLTSNPGAADFLSSTGLYRAIATKSNEWNSRGNVGLVVGATNPEQLAEIRSLSPQLPFLVPGVGAQGGSLERVVRDAAMAGDFSGLVIHVTRGILPKAEDEGELVDIIRAKTEAWNARVAEARG